MSLDLEGRRIKAENQEERENTGNPVVEVQTRKQQAISHVVKHVSQGCVPPRNASKLGKA